MNPLVKKEIRLLLPAWSVAVLLALVQGITRPYDFYVASLLGFGLTMMALTTIGREASLNTFSSLVALPAERIRIWKTKLSVLAAAFLIVFAVWLAAFGVAFLNSKVDLSDRQNSYNLFFTICLIATATFTGGLWTTLLLRQLASAFWLTLLVPATLAGFSGVFLAGSESDNLVIAVLSVVIGVYSIAGFLFARWLFFRAQDVGWSGGVIALPEWTFLSARAGTAEDVRKRQPIFALLKKELLLQQGVLTGAAGLLVFHAGILGLRAIHQFPKNSAGEGVGEILTSIVWMLWLVLPVVLGSIAVAEERKVGVMESQLSLPVSRRTQFVVKACTTVGLGIFLGGAMPTLLESIGVAIGSRNPIFMSDNYHYDQARLRTFFYGTMAFSAWITLLGLFASSLAKSFLQAISIALVTFIGLSMCLPALTNGQMIFFNFIPPHSLLPLIVAIPTIVVTLLWLAYLNFKNFREGWPLWRRNLLGVVGACLFINVATPAIYERAWEAFEPAESAHGPAKFSLANPPELRNESYENLLVRLPDGRVWFDFLSNRHPFDGRIHWWQLVRWILNPLPRSAGPQQFIAGSSWVDASARHEDEQVETGGQGSRDTLHITGYADTVGIQTDGTLWASDKPDPETWTADRLTRCGDESNWQQFARGPRITSVLLLKKDGTLWCWGTNHFDFHGWPQAWPGLRAFQPYQIGADADWTGIFSLNGFLARKGDGSVWRVWGNAKNGRDELIRATNYDQIVTQNFSKGGFGEWGAYVRSDGTLWVFGSLRGNNRSQPEFETLQSGREATWVAVARTWDWMVAIKNDGTLWLWQTDSRQTLAAAFSASPTRLGIHRDWLSVVGVEGGVVSLAADGSLWFWPNPNRYQYSGDLLENLLRLPKQPQFIGNVFQKP
jgi:hypothetical protein